MGLTVRVAGLLLASAWLGSSATAEKAAEPNQVAAGALRALASARADERTQGFRVLSEIRDLVWLRDRLASQRATPAFAFRRLIFEIGAQIPNPSGTDPIWIDKRIVVVHPPPGAPRRTKHVAGVDPEQVNWAQELAAIDLATPTFSDLTPALWQTTRADALEIIALTHALAAVDRMDAIDPLFDAAFEWEGVFRDECGRQIRQLGNVGLPGLLHRMYDKTQKSSSKQRRYASYQLDRMDRARPAKALGSSPSDIVRAAVLHEYGLARAPEAVDEVLRYTDAPSHLVRREARWAWDRYVSGKAPPPAPKRKRKLPGGRQEHEEKADYLTYRELAMLALRREAEAVWDTPVAPGETATDLTQKLFDYYDSKRSAEWNSDFEAAQKLSTDGDIAAAVQGYATILAHDPFYPRRAQAAPDYYRYAELLLRKGDTDQALVYYRQAAYLDIQGDLARMAEARVAWLEGRERLRLGEPDPHYFDIALKLDPKLWQAERDRFIAERRAHGHYRMYIIIVILLLATGISVFEVRRRSRKNSPTPPPLV